MVLPVREEEQVYGLELLDLRNDFVFKSFLGDKRNKKLLLHFLNAILNEQVSVITLIDPHLVRTHKEDKSSVMDIRVESQSGKQINIEIQLQNHPAFNERMLLYWSKMYSSQDSKGEDYSKLRKAVQIIITNFKLFSTNRFHQKFGLMDEFEQITFTNHLEVHMLQLPNVNEEDIENPNELEQWLLFMKSDKKKKEELAMESSVMKEALEEIERLSQDPETRRLADYRAHELRGIVMREAGAREEGRERGIEQGIEQNRREIVLHMLKQKNSLEEIASLTGIPIQRVKEIVELSDRS